MNNTQTKSRPSRSIGFSNKPKRRGPRPSGGGRGFSRGGHGGRGGGRPAGRQGGRGGTGRKFPTFDPSKFINTPTQSVATKAYKATHNTFTTFGLDHRLLKTLAYSGISAPTPIQDQVIPKIMDGHDVIGLAETGTGKTAAFLLPLIHKTAKDNKNLTLIMAPTRELALQINEELKKLTKGLNLSSTTCVGGMNIHPQIRSLHRLNHFIIGTPGRIQDLMKRGDLKPAKVTCVVLDEADRMLDMGFINDMRNILGEIPKSRHTLFFSATMNDSAKALVHDFMNKPVTISVKQKDVIDNIKQNVVKYSHNNKFETLIAMLKKPEYKKVIIFGSMKHSVKKLTTDLISHGIKSESIHGNKSHSQRQRTLVAFKNGDAKVLVATDVAARGIHVDNVSHVINYDLPGSFEDYVHRIGRTGRAEKRGIALTFIPEKSF